MGTIVIPKTGRQVKKRKKCKYPECNITFDGIGPAKYCEEHQKPDYRKHINKILTAKKKLSRKVLPDANIIIKHDHAKPVDIECTCALPNCGNVYIITLYPKTYTYPKYCPEHRNEFKRQQFTKRLDKTSST